MDIKIIYFSISSTFIIIKTLNGTIKTYLWVSFDLSSVMYYKLNGHDNFIN